MVPFQPLYLSSPTPCCLTRLAAVVARAARHETRVALVLALVLVQQRQQLRVEPRHILHAHAVGLPGVGVCTRTAWGSSGSSGRGRGWAVQSRMSVGRVVP